MDWFYLAASLATGVMLGLLYFGGLWLTMRSLPAVRYPALVALGSFFTRTALLLAAFYLVMDGHWERLGACLTGFVVARNLVVRRLRGVSRQGPDPTAEEPWKSAAT